ncbi:heparin-binding hemagglutinin [Mycobacterium sp.]|uniref:heparin-binding hemagglutinin n=1 Tax=Mycobacterium sp. TaxID=1785 RepID=UPI003F9BE868
MAEKNQPTIDNLRTPLLAAIGAADLALATVNELVANLRERAGEATADASTRADKTRERLNTRVEETRERLMRQEDLPKEFGELRKRFTRKELREAAERYLEAATTTYNNLVERGEAALERLRSQPAFEANVAKGQGYLDDAVERTGHALDTVASQTRAAGERAAKLIGVELPKKTEAAAASVKKAANKTTAKKQPAKKLSRTLTAK